VAIHSTIQRFAACAELREICDCHKKITGLILSSLTITTTLTSRLGFYRLFTGSVISKVPMQRLQNIYILLIINYNHTQVG